MRRYYSVLHQCRLFETECISDSNELTAWAAGISEEQARVLLMNDKKSNSETSGDILNNTTTMDYHQPTGVLSSTFRNMVCSAGLFKGQFTTAQASWAQDEAPQAPRSSAVDARIEALWGRGVLSRSPLGERSGERVAASPEKIFILGLNMVCFGAFSVVFL